MKGISYILEAFIALSMLGLAATGFFATIAMTDVNTLPSRGYYVLSYLDSSGILRNAAANHDADAIRAAIAPYFDRFEIVFCEPECAQPSSPANSVVNYFISGYHSYSPLQIRLYLW